MWRRVSRKPGRGLWRRFVCVGVFVLFHATIFSHYDGAVTLTCERHVVFAGVGEEEEASRQDRKGQEIEESLATLIVTC